MMRRTCSRRSTCAFRALAVAGRVFRSAGARASGEYEVANDGLVECSTGRRFDSGVSPHDDEIHEIFGQSGRLSDEDVERIASHAVAAAGTSGVVGGSSLA
jgi:hypothetical protein